MRWFTVAGLLGLLSGCAGNQVDVPGDGADPAPVQVAEVQQRSQFADATIVNLVDPISATLTLTADLEPVDVQIFYIGDKTTNSGRTVSAPVLVDTISLSADETDKHNVNLLHPAFFAGYGSILLQSVTGNQNDKFQTYAQYGGSMFSTGGSVFTGGSYRIPYLSGTIRVVLVLTNQSDFPFNVDISNVGTATAKTISLAPLSTYRFDSGAEGWVLSGNNSIQIFTSSGGTVAVSGYIDRLLSRTRINPVKASPYP